MTDVQTDRIATARDTAHRGGFLRKVTVATGGGMFIDGFVFASFAAALAGAGMSRTLGDSGFWSWLISPSTLIGTFIGGLTLGWVTDKVGRRPMFTIDLSVFLACALLMFAVTATWQVSALGLLMGIAIGADYSIGSPLLAEFTEEEKRGHYLGLLEILWNVGYVAGYLVGYLVNTYQPGAWRFILAASAVPAIICLIIRHGLPESPRWLLSKGRSDEAYDIIDAELGRDRRADFEHEQEEETNFRLLFSPDYLRRTVFACLFWAAIVTPYFALTFFQADVLKDLGLGSGALIGALLGTCVALAGAAIGWLLVDRVGRRPLLILPMFGCAVCLAVAAFAAQLPTVVGAAAFFGYLLSYGPMSILPGIYPEEVFPTSVRTSGVGLASSASRVGAAIGTFALPVVIAHLGLSWALGAMALVSLLGGVMSLAWAPETARKSLAETSDRAAPNYARRPALAAAT
jgi:MFS transporter, putative metabolite transport protein